MNSRGGPYSQWPARNRSHAASGRFMPVQGTFSDPAPRPIRYATQDPRHPPIGSNPAHAFFPPQPVYNGHPTVPITNAEYEQAHESFTAAPYHESLNAPLFRDEPVEHEGFIPAPGHENDHITAPEPVDKNPYGYDYETSSEEDFNDSEEERLIGYAALTHDRDEDGDFSLSDEELEENPEDFMIVDADNSEEETVPKRGKTKTRGARGGRRGGSRGVARRGKPKGKGTRPRAVADPGPKFKELQRLANEAYMKEDYETAMKHAREAIKLNPEIFSAYSLLSEIYAAMGNEVDSVMALIGGAPTNPSKDLWLMILERLEKLDPNERPMLTQKDKDKLAVRCLTSIINLDGEDWDARYRKLNYEVGRKRYSACMRLCQKMLKIKPHDKRVLETMAKMGTADDQQTALHLSELIETFEAEIEYFKRQKNRSDSGLDFSFLNIYLDLLDKEGNYSYALSRLKSLTRWIQKRHTETYWDKLDDDREFDFEDVPRRIRVPEFVNQTKKRRGNYGKSLPLELSIKMGLFRLRLTPPNIDEAMRHLDLLFPEDDTSEDSLLWDDTEHFRTVAKRLYEAGYHREALRFYEPLYKHHMLPHTLETFMALYACYRSVGDTETAGTVLPILKSLEPSSKDFTEWAMMAKFFEDHGLMKEAMDYAEIVFKNRASMLLRNNGFQRYDELRRHFFKARKQARGGHRSKQEKTKKYMKKLRMATRNEMDSDQEENTGERPSLPPLEKRPRRGLFRTRERTLAKKPQTFMLEGTGLQLNVIDGESLRSRLAELATKHAEEVPATRRKHREIVASFGRLDELSDEADNDDESASSEYLSVARELIEEFSTFDLFYYDRRHAFTGYFRQVGSGHIWKESALMLIAVAANREEDGEMDIELSKRPTTVPEDFYGVHFDKWAEMFCRYALLLARQGADDRCFSVLDVALQSNIFYKSQRYACDIELCRLSCALAFDNSQQASAAVRYLLKIYPFGTEIFRLYSAANRLCSINDGYATGAASKVVMRWIKTVDYALLSPENRKWYNFKGDDRTQWMQHTVNSGMIDHVKGHDPALFALFGHILMCTGSYTAALNYFYRAFAITPDDPVLNLSMGIAYFQHALKRLSENRQYQIQQGIAFLMRYRELRTKNKVAIHEQEAEYNVGRVYHGLGLVSQAIPHYQRCIALSDKVKQEASIQGLESRSVEDFAAEAAYSLQTIYVLSGDFEGAFEVSMSNLVIE